MKARRKEDDLRGGGEVVQLAHSSLDSIPATVLAIKSLVILNLSNNNISSLPPELCSIKSLRVLHLSSNHLTSLPPCFNQLFLLETLSLGANRLTSSAIEDACLDKLGQLTRLNLSNNQLSYVPESICDIDTLLSLSLSDNKITEIPESMAKLTRLQFFGISNNQLSSVNDIFSKLPALKGISLAGNPFSDPIGSQTELVELGGIVSVMHISNSVPRGAKMDIKAGETKSTKGVEPPTDGVAPISTASPDKRLAPRVITTLPDPVFPRGDRFSVVSGDTQGTLSSISESERATLFGNSPAFSDPPTVLETIPALQAASSSASESSTLASPIVCDSASSASSTSSPFSPLALYGSSPERGGEAAVVKISSPLKHGLIIEVEDTFSILESSETSENHSLSSRVSFERHAATPEDT
ncbi:uncharacterized protein SPPG_06740 [Spizellomyces punctatus DAOM BR117]|uniref:Uncharacterized protein n=1 Tax=Spizellomyces punctatus (strain DAOM BR117) TaxID=645134 RepID=A0A0L0HAK6_SPIPD|nr:uncharacterized protein SPPG_06740 [Spizellomyces punctatus DAOM BR117]KNC97738.1 hypothetical protein SPPG_06740 [Spizellomyces punctatus DAOM BR117]|eukprot:XP_016605778.1 hypothetical protein SPPG_06740 [Spizellomyces punctatus DAOM BR117]